MHITKSVLLSHLLLYDGHCTHEKIYQKLKQYNFFQLRNGSVFYLYYKRWPTSHNFSRDL